MTSRVAGCSLPAGSLRCLLLIGVGLVLALGAAACSGEPEAATGPTPTPVVLIDPQTPTPVPVPTRVPTMFDEVDDLVNPQVPTLQGSIASNGPDENGAIVLGGVVTETVDGAPVLPGVCAGAEARLAGAIARAETTATFDWAGCTDDAGFPDRSANAVERLLFREPFAIVPLMSETFFDADVLNAETVPYFGIGSQPAYCGIENGFGFGTGGAQSCPVLDVLGITTSGPVYQAWLSGTNTSGAGLRVAHIAEGSVSGEERIRSRTLEVESVGSELVLVNNRLFGAAHSDTDLDRVAESVLAASADVLIVEVSGAEALYPRLRDGGFDGSIISVELDPALLGTDDQLRADLEDTWHVVGGLSLLPAVGVIPSFDQDVAGLARDQIGLGFISGYASMDVFLSALDDTPEPLTTARLHDTINAGWRYEGIPNLVCAADWPTAHLVSVPCASLVRVTPDGDLREVMGPTPFDLLVEESG